MIRAITIVSVALCLCACDPPAPSTPVSSSGVSKVNATVHVDPNTGMTIEQDNVKRRVEWDNKPGAIKHLYIVSPMTGDVLMYSAVKGKVTSGGKRLTPKSVTGHNTGQWVYGPQKVEIAGGSYYTNEVIQDDGTYGDSSEYIFWWDTKGVYHQQGVQGALWHVSDQPLIVGKAKITIDEYRP